MLRGALSTFRAGVMMAIAAAGMVPLCSVPARGQAPAFNWDNPIVYFVLTDRFVNGVDGNDDAYGRGANPPAAPDETRTGFFHGGDLVGLTRKIREGYFDSLGVNVLWVSSPFEQIHGYVGGGRGDFRAYAYHGYWTMDFSALDSSLGSENDFAEFVRSSHQHGIRVVLDVSVNHPGYHTLRDMTQFGFAPPPEGDWSGWRPGPGETWHDYHDRFIDYASGAEEWRTWWGPDWIRAGLPGYAACGDEDTTMCLSSLPDFRTESSDSVDLPAFLVTKWGDAKVARESRELAEFFRRRRLQPTVSSHLVKWVTDWVRRYGIDGFRLDAAKHLDLPTIATLRIEAEAAFEEWKAANPGDVLDRSGFWMTGEVFGHGVERSAYFDAGLSSILNFAFQPDLLARRPIDSLYAAYSDFVVANPGTGILSFISSHDTQLYPRDRLARAATRFMLLPGGVQIFYGDESSRPDGTRHEGTDEHTRSPMNWDSADADLLKLWRTLGAFRRRHIAVAAGRHEKLAESPYSFRRTYRVGASRDEIVAVLGAEGRIRVNVSAAFEDNALIRDAVTGNVGIVSFGMISLNADKSGLMLLEELAE